MYVGCIMYADDIILLSASLNMLQRILKNLWNWGTLFRYEIVAMSTILRVGYRPMQQSVPNFLLMVVSYSLWLCKIKYLVEHLLSGKIRNSGWVCMFFKDLYSCIALEASIMTWWSCIWFSFIANHFYYMPRVQSSVLTWPVALWDFAVM